MTAAQDSAAVAHDGPPAAGVAAPASCVAPVVSASHRPSDEFATDGLPAADSTNAGLFDTSAGSASARPVTQQPVATGSSDPSHRMAAMSLSQQTASPAAREPETCDAPPPGLQPLAAADAADPQSRADVARGPGDGMGVRAVLQTAEVAASVAAAPPTGEGADPAAAVSAAASKDAVEVIVREDLRLAMVTGPSVGEAVTVMDFSAAIIAAQEEDDRRERPLSAGNLVFS